MKRLIIFLTILIFLSGCTNNSNKLTEYSKTSIDSGFNTFINIVGYCDSEETFNKYYNEGISAFQYYNQLFDIYNNYQDLNNLKTINDNAGIQAVKVDSSIIELLLQAKAFSELSNGFFDITAGAVISLWHDARIASQDLNNNGENGFLPDINALENASKHIGFENVIIDEENKTVFITDANTQIDVGGIAKGFAAEKIAQQLENDGLEYGVVNAGGNNRIINSKPDGSQFVVGIENPSFKTPTLLSVTANDDSLSFVTSGDYQNYFWIDDANYNHIINLNTLYPADYYHSVTVICKNSTYADALSTSLFSLSYEEGTDLITAFNDEHPDNQVAAIWVMDPSKQFTTDYGQIVQDYFVVYTANLENEVIIP